MSSDVEDESVDTTTVEQNITDSEIAISEIKENTNAYIAQFLPKMNWTDQKSFDLFESTEGGVLTIFFVGEEIIKMTEENYGETGFQINEYYFKNEQLVYVSEQFVRYNVPYYMDEYDPTLDQFYEDISYFDNSLLIDRVVSEKEDPYYSSISAEPAQERLLNRVTELKAFLN